MYFCGYVALSSVPNWEVICIIPIFGIHFWSKFGYLTPWGDHISGYPLLFGNSFRRNIIMLCPKCISVVTLHYQMVQIGKYLHNTHICGNVWSTFWYFTPGVSIYRVTPHCFAINFEEIPSCFVLNVFLWLLCIIKWSKLGSYLHNTNIWVHFWSKIGYLTPRGDHIYGYSLLFCN